MAFNRMERVMIPRACLVAILLVARSSSGVNFVFHYPPNPKIDSTAPSSSVWRGAGSHTDGTTSDSNSSAGSSDEDFDAPESGPETKGELADIDPSESDMRSRSYPGKQRRRHRDDHDDDDDEDDDHVRLEQSGPAWESLFGFKVSFLASLLAPKATTCRTKFELTIDDLVFLGYPVQVKPDGTWKKKRKKKKARSKKAMDSELVSVQGDEANAGDEADDENDGDEGENQDSDASEKKDGMTMFHVVFVMNPPELEYHSRVQDMYGCVVKKFAKALTLEQARSDYVGRETELILRMRERAAHEGEVALWSLEFVP